MNYIVADVGGTKTLIAIARYDAGNWKFERKTRMVSRDYPSAEAMIARWVQSLGSKSESWAGIGIALAGPVQSLGDFTSGRATNLDWPELCSRDLARQFDVPTVLINDFAAIGASLDALDPADTVSLQTGNIDTKGLRLVVGAGTGLGTCLVGPPPESLLFAGEGGHAGFAPANGWEATLAEWIRHREGRCSREHVLSGPGIARIAAYLQAHSPDAALAEALRGADPAAAIGTMAQRGSTRALQVIERFVSIYGGQLGDLALGALPRGGVYIAGGIAPRWLHHFQGPEFIRAFRDKAPMQKLMKTLHLSLIVHPEPGLLGAAVAIQQVVASFGERKA